VALHDDYRAYRGAIAAGIRLLRPHVEVATTGLDALEDEAARLDPHVVICSLPATADSGERLAWVELSLDPARPSVVRVGGSYSKQSNPALEALLRVIDEAERLVGEESNTGTGSR
jgi:hypothetical protein